MSQNFSNMADIYIPELMELDSYWQKAVEDAICDTLKGEKRLHSALRNRKKINQKLEKLGLKHVYSQIHFSNIPPTRPESAEEQEASESDSELSKYSENGSKKVDPEKSKSKNKNNGDPPFGEKPKNPERPLLGNGSLEKMKKSQNSFNCEPMGVENLNEELSESEKEKDTNYCVSSKMSSQDERNKIQWLHVRDDSDFEDSDAASAEEAPENEHSEKNDFCTRASVKSKNYFMKKISDLRLPHRTKKRKNFKTQKKFGHQEDLVLKNELKNLMRQSPRTEQRLALAWAKREMLRTKSSSIRSNALSLELHQSEAKMFEKRRKGKKHSSPFINFYLEVDRELCHKYPEEYITKEAARRWRAMNKARKSDIARSRHK